MARADDAQDDAEHEGEEVDARVGGGPVANGLVEDGDVVGEQKERETRKERIDNDGISGT